MDEAAVSSLAPEPGWSPISARMVRERGTAYLSDDPETQRVRLRYYQRDADGAIVGKAWWGPGAEGPPGHAHGGSIMAVLDEAMGKAAWHTGVPVLAARVNVSFRRVLPLGSEVLFEAWIDRESGKKLNARARLLAPDGAVFAEAEGLFVRVGVERFVELGATEVEQEHAGAQNGDDESAS